MAKRAKARTEQLSFCVAARGADDAVPDAAQAASNAALQ